MGMLPGIDLLGNSPTAMAIVIMAIAVAEVKAETHDRRLEIDRWRIIEWGGRIDRGRIINSRGRGVVNSRSRRVITVAVRGRAVARIRITG